MQLTFNFSLENISRIHELFQNKKRNIILFRFNSDPAFLKYCAYYLFITSPRKMQHIVINTNTNKYTFLFMQIKLIITALDWIFVTWRKKCIKPFNQIIERYKCTNEIKIVVKHPANFVLLNQTYSTSQINIDKPAKTPMSGNNQY